jgi:hypothetical protein
MADQQPPRLPQEVYATLAGVVDGQMVQRVFNNFAMAINGGVRTVHLSWSSQPAALLAMGSRSTTTFAMCP